MRDDPLSFTPDPGTAAAMATAKFALLVDDDPLAREVSGDLLQELGYTVMTAASGEEALAAGDIVHTPSVLIIDINLGSGMDGFEFGSRARGRWPNVPIMYFSGRPCPDRKLNTLGRGEIFLMKPVAIRAMEQAIASVTNPS